MKKRKNIKQLTQEIDKATDQAKDMMYCPLRDPDLIKIRMEDMRGNELDEVAYNIIRDMTLEAVTRSDWYSVTLELDEAEIRFSRKVLKAW